VGVPALVIRPRLVVSPEEYSLGVSPTKPMKWRADANRRQSATSAAIASAPRWVNPR
jgi:hypothetical protein